MVLGVLLLSTKKLMVGATPAEDPFTCTTNAFKGVGLRRVGRPEGPLWPQAKHTVMQKALHDAIAHLGASWPIDAACILNLQTATLAALPVMGRDAVVDLLNSSTHAYKVPSIPSFTCSIMYGVMFTCSESTGQERKRLQQVSEWLLQLGVSPHASARVQGSFIRTSLVDLCLHFDNWPLLHMLLRAGAHMYLGTQHKLRWDRQRARRQWCTLASHLTPCIHEIKLSP